MIVQNPSKTGIGRITGKTSLNVRRNRDCTRVLEIGSRLSEIATVAKSHIKAKRVKDHYGLKKYTVLE
eukprot:7881330-Ditylum_brightwellii.AAC.1